MGGKKATEATTDVVDTETQADDFNTDAAVADISSELFGQGDDEEEGGEKLPEGEKDSSSGVSATDVDDPSPQTEETTEAKAAREAAEAGVTAKENTEAVQEIGAPKTWTKEELAKWATIPPEIQKDLAPILQRREEDFLKGISQYKAAADVGMAYDSVVEPYKPLLQAENVDPIQLFQSFAGNHYILSRGTPEQKVQLAAAMFNGYNIDLASFLNHIAENPVEPVDPRVAALEAELNSIKSVINSGQKQAHEAVEAQVLSEVEQFAADPAHPHFNELAADISKLFETGMAKTLPEAYEKALYANPTTRQKELDRLTAEKLAAAETERNQRKDKRQRSTADHVSSIPKSKDGTVPLGSIDDTLEATMREIENRS